MGKSSDPIQRVVSEIAASSKRCPTEAGHPDDSPARGELIDAINQVFALFQVNYHNQYYSAFGDNTRSENLAKKLWLGKLEHFTSSVICRAAERIIADSEYLPTLHKMLEACRSVAMPNGLPEARRAYLEACNKASPKIQQSWSHAIVYLSARDCGWYTLANATEAKALPAFTEIYRGYCDALLSGQTFAIEQPAALPETSAVPSSTAQRKQHLKDLHKLFD